MFNSKKTTLFEKSSSTSTFVEASLKSASKTLSANGADKYLTTGNDFIDQFSKMGSYKNPRNYSDIAFDMSKLWGNNPRITIMFTIFLRMITRIVSFFDGSKTSVPQRGGGLKHESIMRMIWLHVNHEDSFYKNLHLFISAGSWKDIIQMLSYDLQYNNWKNRILDWNKLGKFILAGLENPNTSELVKKYLPQIKANSKCKTIEAQADNIIAKWIASLLFGGKTAEDNYKNYRSYRKLKTSGTAHQWQQLISQGKYLDIDFNTIHGKALAQLVSSAFLTKKGLEKAYEAWIDTKPIAKFTGYPVDLFVKEPKSVIQIKTFNAQFDSLVKTAKTNAKNTTRFISVIDTSDSMDSMASGIKMSNKKVAKIMGLFFARMLDKGPFAKVWYNFSHTAEMRKLSGSTPWEQWESMKRGDLCCDTNFQAVIDHIITIKMTNPAIAESEFPNGLLVLSDGEFNKSTAGSNAETAYQKLSKVFSKEFMDNFKFVWWMLQSSAGGNKFETYGKVPNNFYFSGYDGSIIAFLTGVDNQKTTPKNAEELFEAAMSQELLSIVEV